MVFQKYMDRVLERADEFSENKDAILRFAVNTVYCHPLPRPSSNPGPRPVPRPSSDPGPVLGSYCHPVPRPSSDPGPVLGLGSYPESRSIFLFIRAVPRIIFPLSRPIPLVPYLSPWLIPSFIWSLKLLWSPTHTSFPAPLPHTFNTIIAHLTWRPTIPTVTANPPCPLPVPLINPILYMVPQASLEPDSHIFPGPSTPYF